MLQSTTPIRHRRPLLGILAALALFYMAQPVRNGPNPVDGALLLGTIDALAGGQALHSDLIDLYGPVHWWAQTLAYGAAGDRVIGVRLWLLALKGLGIVLSYALVARIAGAFWAVSTCVWLVLLLGVRWQLLQSPYPFLQAWVLALAVWHLLLFQHPERRPAVTVSAGVLTALTIWTKLNAGLFLLAGGLFVSGFLLAQGPKRGGLPKPVGLLGLGAYGAAFGGLLWQHLDIWFAVYLMIPLALTVGYAARALVRGHLVVQARPALLYATSAAVSSAVILVMSFGPSASLDYISTLGRILSALNYTADLPPIGEPGPLVGFNEWYWPQLPWAASAAAAGWMANTTTFPRALNARARQLLGVWALTSAHLCVMYSRPDESHIYQALLAAVPALFLFTGSLVAGLASGARRLAKAGAGVAVVLAAPSLWATPSLHPFETRPSPWANPKLAFIDFQLKDDPYVKAAFFHDRELVDRRCNEAATTLDRFSDDDDTLLVLTSDELMPLNANMQAAGGRYRYYFYLLKNGFIDRNGLDALMPDGALQALIRYPPEWIMGAPNRSSILDELPEFDRLLKTRYRRAAKFGHVILYRRVPSG